MYYVLIGDKTKTTRDLRTARPIYAAAVQHDEEAAIVAENGKVVACYGDAEFLDFVHDFSNERYWY